jgi:hypothetical protein
VEKEDVTELEPPYLERRDLEAQLRPYLENRRHHLFAVFGRGEEQVLHFENAPDMIVRPVRSELELRARMPPLTDENARIVFLVPWTDRMPIDLSGRFMGNGRVIRIGKEARLKHLFGVGEIDAEAVQSPLSDWLLRGRDGRRYTLREGRLTLDALWATWLHHDQGLDTEGGLGLDVLLGWAAVDGRGKSFDVVADQASTLEPALLKHLEGLLGPAGPLAWRAWREGRGALLIELAILFEVLADSHDAAVRMWMKQRLRNDFGITDETKIAQLPADLGRVAAAALRYVERRTEKATVRAHIRAAEERVDESEVRHALLASVRLPLALEARREALGDALADGAREPTPDAVRKAEALLHAWEGHTLSHEGDNEPLLHRAWMAVRLLAWLAARPDRGIPVGMAPYAAVEALGRWYAEEGGFVDWARRAARGTAESRFGRGVQAVVAAADRARAELDRTFALGLREWCRAGQPSKEVVPIDTALERIAVRFLEQSPERSLLVVLLDGMAWAQGVELLDSLFQKRAWGPLVWHATKAGRIGEGAYPVVLAALPSVTEVSRAAFFGGKAIQPGRSEDTQKDRDRFREHKAVGKLFSGHHVPTLLLRAEGQTKGGAASEEALRLVADTERRVVAVVINAIDDALKGNPTTRHAWEIDTIRALADLLEKARASGRAVMLASDHGHVPSDLLDVRGTPMGGGARWRPLASESDEVHDFEVAFPAGRVWAPKGAWGVALLADDTARWGPSTHSGEHGGATLAEVVAPCVLVGSEDLQGPIPDEALNIRPPYVPAWWHLAVVPALDVPLVEALQEVAPATPEQLGLPSIVPPAETTPPPSSKRAAARPPSPFARSKVLEARAPESALRKEVVRAVDYLLARNGLTKADAFAAEMGIVKRRAGGLVAKLQEVLNVDGYEVLRFQANDEMVVLDVGKLRLLFEVPE